MNKRIVLFLFLFCVGGIHYSYSQTQAFTIHDTIPIRAGTNKFRLYRLIEKWFETERGTRLVAKNRKELHFKGKGFFIYTNRVKIPDIFLSPHANARCKGSIAFTIDVKIQDSVIVSKFTQFVHEAVYSEYGSMSFGMLMVYDKVPPGFCMEVEEWCNAVWNDMKDKSEKEVKDRSSRMIPPILIRRRTFRVKEEEVKVEVKDTVDPKKYLELDRYYNPEDKKPKEVSTRTDDIPGITDVVIPKTTPVKETKGKETSSRKQNKEKDEVMETDEAIRKPDEDTEQLKKADDDNDEKSKAIKQDNTPKEKAGKKEKAVNNDDIDEYEEATPKANKQEEAPKEKPTKQEAQPKEKTVKETPAPKEKAAPAPKSKPEPAAKPEKKKPEPKKSKPADDDYDDYDDE